MAYKISMDLNCDLGEGAGHDEQIMPHITSANIACGFHAGDEESMRQMVKLAKRFGVSIGAHPGWNDKENFGRNEVQSDAENVYSIVIEQIRSLAQIAGEEGCTLTHVKPHGALYNQAAKDGLLAAAIARAVKSFSADLILVGLAGSKLHEAGVEAGLRTASEGFPDRAYNSDGTLMPRSLPGAVIEDPHQVALNAVKLARNGINFNGLLVRVDTLCLHGDNKHAAENAILLREELEQSGIEVKALAA